MFLGWSHLFILLSTLLIRMLIVNAITVLKERMANRLAIIVLNPGARQD